MSTSLSELVGVDRKGVTLSPKSKQDVPFAENMYHQLPVASESMELEVHFAASVAVRVGAGVWLVVSAGGSATQSSSYTTRGQISCS